MAGEIKNVGTAYPRAMIMANCLSVSTYVIPMALSMGMYTREKWVNWDIGYFGKVGDFIGGRFLLIWMTISAMICNLGLFNASLLTCARGLAFMAQNKMLPSIFGRVSRFGTPYVAIIFNALITCILILLPFQVLVDVEIVINSLSLILLYVSFVYLRYKRADMKVCY